MGFGMYGRSKHTSSCAEEMQMQLHKTDMSMILEQGWPYSAVIFLESP